MLTTLTASVSAFFSAITSRVSGLLPHHVLVVDVTDRPFSVVSAKPVAFLNIVEDDTELTTAQMAVAPVLDGRDNMLHTPDGSGGWTTTLYAFDKPFLRPMSLCYSPVNARMYFVREDHTVLRVNLSLTATRSLFNV